MASQKPENIRVPAGSNAARDISIERKPEDRIMEANNKAAGRTAFVGALAERLFMEVWKDLDPDEMADAIAVSRDMDQCISVAEAWREKINAYQEMQAEAIHDAAVARAKESKLILPTSNEIKHHFPNGAIAGVS